jgi:NADP-dependent 3-hydroxy acid dehydrogenase YdfG
LTPPFLNQVAVVVGASGAIGGAIAARLVDGGATVCLVGRTRDSLNNWIRPGGTANDRLDVYGVDLEDEASITAFCAEVGRRYRSIDALIHSAGTFALAATQDAHIADFDRQYRVNVRGPYLMTQGLLTRLIDARGQIVFINSSAGLHARKGAGQYAASKHALRGIADTLREEVNEHGVRVLSVFPGRTASRLQAAVHDHEGRRYHPENLLQPDDVASVVVQALALPRTAEVTDISLRPFKKTY